MRPSVEEMRQCIQESQMTRRSVHLIRPLALLCATIAGVSSAAPTVAQSRGDGAASRLVIAMLANDTHPADLDFQGGECEVEGTGRSMECVFQQVFLTIAPFDPQTCLVTTNRYERRFEKQSDAVWVSREGPDGPCAVLDIATLRDEGNGVRWSLELRKTFTDRSVPECRSDEAPVETFSWKNVRRPLPCRFVQPGAVR
jgi:hypothetical protein